MERRANRDQGEEEEKGSTSRSFLYKDHNSSVTVTGPIDVFHVEGHNNKIVLVGAIRKLILAGHNNQIAAESNPSEEEDEALVAQFVISGHNNNIDNVPCDKLIINGHNNTVLVTDCTSFSINGINNNVYNNGEEVYAHSASHSHSHAHNNGFVSSTSISHGSQSHVHNINISGPRAANFEMPAFNIDVGEFGVEINSYVQGILNQCGFDMDEAQVEHIESDEAGDDVSPEQEDEYVIDAEEGPEELTEEEREQIINSFPLHKFIPGKEKSDTCSICLERLKKNETIRTLLCMHSFHQKCLDPWLDTNLICPLCRNPLISE